MELEKRIKETLTEGLIVNSYRAMCRLLDEPIKGGKSKKIQIEDWKRYFDWKHDKYKFIILEIYDEPREKVDGRINNGGNTSNSKYLDYIKPILINYIIENDYSLKHSFSKIVNDLELFNEEEYNLILNDHEKLARINGLDEDIVKGYGMSIRNTVEGSFKSAFNNLKNHGLATYEHRFMIMQNNYEIDVATDKEINEILEAEQEVYLEMDINYQRRILAGLDKEFRRRVSNKLNIANYWKAHIVKLDRKVTEEKEDMEELIKRYITTIHNSTMNKRKKKGFTEGIYPLMVEKLNRLIWNTDYKMFPSVDDAMFELCGISTDKEQDSPEEQELDNFGSFDDFVSYSNNTNQNSNHTPVGDINII